MTTALKDYLGDDFDERIKAKFANVEFTRDMMHPYQETAFEFLLNNPFSALFIDMGLGKTVSAGTLIAHLLMALDDEKVLIIAPMRVATDTWPTEIQRWEHLAPFNYSVIYADDDDPRIAEASARARQAKRADLQGRAMFTSEINKEVNSAAGRAGTQMKEEIRIAAVNSTASIHIIPRDWVEWLCSRMAANWPYTTVIIDESSGFKDWTTARFKALSKIRNAGKITRLHCLTATPAAENYAHLFGQVFLMDGGKRLGLDVNNFLARYFTKCPYTKKYKIRPGGEEDILAKITDICLVMKSKDYLDLEEPTFVVREVHMTESETTLYETMKKDAVLELPDGSVIEAETAAALSSKLLQMGSGVLYETRLEPGQTEDDDMARVKKVHHIHNHKIEMLKDIVEGLQGRPVLVGYHFKSSLARLQAAFPNAVVMDKMGKCIKKWNKGEIPMLLMHPQSGGHGLNLQKGGHNIVFFDIPWSLELYLQFIGRLARQGQKHRVLVQLLVTKGTLDRTVVDALTAKEDAQEALFRILIRMRRALAAAKTAIGKARTSSKAVRAPVSVLDDDDEL